MEFNLVFASPEAEAFYEGKAPSYATQNSCALDLRACIPEPLTLHWGEQKLIGSGLKIQPVLTRELPLNKDNTRVGSIILPRSGKGAKEGLMLGNTIGLIDADYQGEIMMMVTARPTASINSGVGLMADIFREPLRIQPGERIAQLAFLPFIIAQAFHILSEFPAETDRGAGGFGSTGHQ